MMKRYITITLILSSFLLNAQTLVFEDQDFLDALIAEGIDTNNDNLIQESEAEAVIEIELNGNDFKSINGIEGFINLEYLDILSNNLIDTVDVLGLTSLKSLKLTANVKLQTITVSGHPSLEEIYLDYNGGDILDEIVEINISNNPTLEKVYIQYMRAITAIKISDNDNLREIKARWNETIQVFDVTELKGLELLWLHGTFNEIITGELPLLEEYRWNLSEPLNLDLDLYPKLKKLYIQPDYTNITEIELANHPVLEEIYIATFSNVNFVKCSNLESLQSIWIQNINGLKTVTLDSVPSITEVYFQGLHNLEDVRITNALELEELSIYGEKINDVTLYNLPKVRELRVYSHRIETLDLSTLNSLEKLDLTSSTIEQLYCKNNSNENLDCTDCSSLEFICADDIDTYENLPPSVYIGSFCPYTSGGNEHELFGTILYDYGNNGCDTLGIPMPYVSLTAHQSDSIVGLVGSNGAGIYGVYYNQDSFLLTPSDNSFNNAFNFLPDSIYVMPSDSIRKVTQDICVDAKEDILNLELVMIDPQETRPGEEAEYKLMIRNICSAAPDGKITLNFEGDYLSLVEANPMTSAVDSNRIEWELPTMLPFDQLEFDVTFLLNTPMDEFPLNGDDTLKYEIKAMVEYLSIDTTITNTLCDVVVNSFDPNDKQCMQGRWIQQKSLDDYLYYTIRFENLGTADARNIVVQDTLELGSYITSSFQLVDASHEVSPSIDRNVISFIFEDINLGFNDDENDGYLIFKIKPKKELEVGHDINNSASIYFDYNFPIHTNLAKTTVIDDLILNNLNVEHYHVLEFYPSISSDLIYLNDKNITGDVVFLDMNGSIILKSNVSNGSSIDISSLHVGVYFVQIMHHNEIFIGKLVKI